MGLPAVLKHFNVFNEGRSCLGEVEEVKLPDLKRKMDPFRGGGMDGPVKIDLGQEELNIEHTYGGIMEQIFEQYGVTGVSGVMLRFAGSYQRDDTAAIQAVEVVVRGRHEEITQGSQKPGEKGNFNVKSTLSYYKLTIDNKVKIEIDLMNMIMIVNGKDMLAEHRKAIGLA